MEGGLECRTVERINNPLDEQRDAADVRRPRGRFPIGPQLWSAHLSTFFGKSRPLDPRYILAYYVRGVAYVRKSTYKKAMSEFEKGVSISPDDPVALTGLGYGYAVTGRRANATGKQIGRAHV